jgi:hypothetical protein
MRVVMAQLNGQRQWAELETKLVARHSELFQKCREEVLKLNEEAKSRPRVSTQVTTPPRHPPPFSPFPLFAFIMAK